MNDWGKHNNNITREEYIKYFGTYKSLKNRYSWSGSCVPTYGNFNYCGQMLKFNDNLDLCIYYSFENDILIKAIKLKKLIGYKTNRPFPWVI